MIKSRQLLSLVASRLHFFLNDRFFRLVDGHLVESDRESLESARFPIIVVGREHYQKSSKKYPVTNERDLRQVLENESSDVHVVSPPHFKEDHTLIQTYELDQASLDLVSDKWCFWIPETWLLNLQPTELLQVSRADKYIWGTLLSGNSYTTVASGAFASPDYFLMSIGASADTKTHVIKEDAYFDKMLEGVSWLSSNQWRELFKAQRYLPKVSRLFSWPSVITGLLLGYGIYGAADLAWLSYQSRSLDNKISQQQVTPVIQKQRLLETRSLALEALADINGDKTLIRNMWQSVIALMEGGNSILRIALEDGNLQIRIESRDANDALALVQNLAYVETADFSTPVRNSVGNKRVTIALNFKEGVINE